MAYLLYMAERTGTLWENVGAYASCNHGFASHIVHTLYRDILGLRRVDPIAKRIAIRIQDLKLASCEGTMPTRDGPVTLAWSVHGKELQYRLSHPAGYQVTIENLSGKPLKQDEETRRHGDAEIGNRGSRELGEREGQRFVEQSFHPSRLRVSPSPRLRVCNNYRAKQEETPWRARGF